jgi:hypothetical protein
MIGHEPFCHTDGDRFINVTSPAFIFTEGRAYSAASQGKGVLFAMDVQGVGVFSLSD